MPLLLRNRVFAAKTEGTIGTAESLTASEAAYNAYDVVIQPTAEFIKRKGQGAGGGNIKGTVGPRSGTMTFKTEITGDGAAGPSAAFSVLLPACGMVESTGTFSVKLEPPGSNVKTLTLAAYENGVKKVISGAVGSFKVRFEPGKPVMFDWTFHGVWGAVSDVSILAPTYPTIAPMRAKSGTLSIGSWAPCFSSLEIDLGNVITPRSCVTAASGIHSYIITEREVVGSFDPEANLVATSNADVYGDWLAGEEDSFSLALTDGTDTITFAAPKFQRTNVQEGERQGLQVDNVSFQMNRTNTGNDEFTIDFS